MSGARPETRAEVVVDGEPVVLAPDEDVEGLKRRFEAAVATGGRFVDFRVAGDRTVSVLTSPGTRVVITLFHAPADEAVAEDDEKPFGTLFEFSHDLG